VLQRVAGSFRDPAGGVFESGELIYRSVSATGAPQYEAAVAAGVLDRLVADGTLVAYERLAPSAGEAEAGMVHLLQHPRLASISHPYEWSFSLLKDAAVFTLDLLIRLLDEGFTLSDASAYNVQFDGPRPVFIDHLSIRPYRDGEFWQGHRQFCEQFLNPLVLRSALGVAHNAWYRGNLEGISVADLARLLPLKRRFSWNVLVHILLQDRFQQSAGSRVDLGQALQQRKLPKGQFRALLQQLRGWIGRMTPAGTRPTTWASYASHNSYSEADGGAKRRFVAEFAGVSKAGSVIDLGCNTGDYSKICLENGASRVVGFDFDQQALDGAHARAKAENLNFLPLFLDARNPSPDQGWRQAERMGFASRFKADAVLALAFEHHLAIAHNVPLDQTLDFIMSIAPQGVVEFVPKDDPTIRTMLALREDIFPDYSEDSFRQLLAARAKIVREEQISSSGRRMFVFQK
jgi:ribosomal protein L11 methylase PrmA